MNNRGRTSLLCPNCRKLISADEPVCPYCGIKKPAARKILLWSRFVAASADITKMVIYINGALFLLSLFIGFPGMSLSANPLNFLSPSQEVLFLLGATGTIPIAGFGRWWTLVSASFLHGGLLHIFFNMMALAQLGPFVSREFGASRFIIIYTLTGAAGFYLSYLAGIPFTIGASASICGLIGAILYYGKRRGGLYGNAIYRQAVGWVAGLVIYGFLVPGINNWAHGGGMVSGILLSMILGYSESREETMLHHGLAASCAILTAVVLFWVVMQTAYFFLFSPL